MKKILLSVFLFFFVQHAVVAQVSGKIRYIASSGTSSLAPSPNPNGYENEYEHEVGVLYFTNTKSLYQQVQNKTFIQVRTGPSGTERTEMPRPDVDTVGWLFAKDLVNKRLLSRDSFWSRSTFAYVSEVLPNIKWKINTERKKIGNYECQQAEADFLGRHWTVWFAPAIPVGIGPWKLGGLPGAILEATDNTKDFVFVAQEINIPAREATAKLQNPYFEKATLLTPEEFRKQYAEKKQKYIRYISSIANEYNGTMKTTFRPHLEML